MSNYRNTNEWDTNKTANNLATGGFAGFTAETSHNLTNGKKVHNCGACVHDTFPIIFLAYDKQKDLTSFLFYRPLDHFFNSLSGKLPWFVSSESSFNTCALFDIENPPRHPTYNQCESGEFGGTHKLVRPKKMKFADLNPVRPGKY